MSVRTHSRRLVSRLRKKRAYILVGCLVAGNLALVWVAFGAPLPKGPVGLAPELTTLSSRSDWSFSSLSDYFTTLANKKGAVYAFNVMRQAPVPPGIDMHLMGHVVGDILYKQEGMDGIKECTQEFRNACSHSIVIGALNQFGTGDATIQKIRDACKKAPGGPGAYTMCYHGLGHGVFAYFGYKIPDTVAFCKRLGTPAYHDEEYPQCVGGMVMELIDGGGHDHEIWAVAHEKYLDPSDPLAPCDSALIPEETKYFCYTYLTPHLFEAAGANLGNPDPATFTKAFSFCTAIEDARMRNVCYAGFGKEFIPLAAARDIRSIDKMSDADYQKAIDWCMKGPNSEAKSACVTQALASVFWGGENDPDASFRLCGLVEAGEVREGCYVALASNIGSYAVGPKRTELCNRIPKSAQGACNAPAAGTR